MDLDSNLLNTNPSSWKPVSDAFWAWLGDRKSILTPGLVPEPTIKVLTFLALLESGNACTYDDIRTIFREKTVIQGSVPDNTLRTSVMNLGRTLEKAGHHLELKSSRGRFQLIKRTIKLTNRLNLPKGNSVILLTDPPAITAEEIASVLVEKAMLPFQGLYFLEWSARWWEAYSSKEAEMRVKYESNAWDVLGTKNRLLTTNNIIGIIGLAPGEGLAEIELLKKILRSNTKSKIHYLAIDSSQRLLRDHIGLLKETLTPEIENSRLICAGVVADIFTGLREGVDRAKQAFVKEGIVKSENEFLPTNCSLLATYFGNCLGNNSYDQEADFFSMLRSTLKNRPLEVLVGVSVLRETPDEYKRNWDAFLLQTPRHLLETKKLLRSISGTSDLAEFILPEVNKYKNERCPPVIPEQYLVRHQIEGQIYRFYYRLAYDLELSSLLGQISIPLPKGTLILLYNIIKYNMKTLVSGIEKCGLFKIEYDNNYHQIIDTANGRREYAVFSAYLEK